MGTKAGKGASANDSAAAAAAAAGAGASEAGDTLCLMGCAEQGLTEQAMIEFFQQLPGFMALRYTGAGKGGGMCFAKFESHDLAQIAMQATQEGGFTSVQIARKSLIIEQASYTIYM